VCPVCGRTISLTAAGNLRFHNHPRHSWHCPGSYETPEWARRLAGDER
jgi:hypothetical protein